MEGSGSSSNLVPCKDENGKDTKVLVMVSHDDVQIGNAHFKREDLFFALGVRK